MFMSLKKSLGPKEAQTKCLVIEKYQRYTIPTIPLSLKNYHAENFRKFDERLQALMNLPEKDRGMIAFAPLPSDKNYWVMIADVNLSAYPLHSQLIACIASDDNFFDHLFLLDTREIPFLRLNVLPNSTVNDSSIVHCSICSSFHFANRMIHVHCLTQCHFICCHELILNRSDQGQWMEKFEKINTKKEKPNIITSIQLCCLIENTIPSVKKDNLVQIIVDNRSAPCPFCLPSDGSLIFIDNFEQDLLQYQQKQQQQIPPLSKQIKITFPLFQQYIQIIPNIQSLSEEQQQILFLTIQEVHKRLRHINITLEEILSILQGYDPDLLVQINVELLEGFMIGYQREQQQQQKVRDITNNNNNNSQEKISIPLDPMPKIEELAIRNLKDTIISFDEDDKIFAFTIEQQTKLTELETHLLPSIKPLVMKNIRTLMTTQPTISFDDLITVVKRGKYTISSINQELAKLKSDCSHNNQKVTNTPVEEVVEEEAKIQQDRSFCTKKDIMLKGPIKSLGNNKIRSTNICLFFIKYILYFRIVRKRT
jgi:hypothetical protein